MFLLLTRPPKYKYPNLLAMNFQDIQFAKKL